MVLSTHCSDQLLSSRFALIIFPYNAHCSIISVFLQFFFTSLFHSYFKVLSLGFMLKLSRLNLIWFPVYSYSWFRFMRFSFVFIFFFSSSPHLLMYSSTLSAQLFFHFNWISYKIDIVHYFFLFFFSLSAIFFVHKIYINERPYTYSMMFQHLRFHLVHS